MRTDVAKRLDEAGWPSIAGDVRDGVPLAVIALRLGDAVSIIAEALHAGVE